MKTNHVVLLSIPGLRQQDLARMPDLARWMSAGELATLAPSFPCLTWPVQANMLTGKRPCEHGVVANGFYWRQQRRVEMWTASNDKIAAPQIWDLLHRDGRRLTSAAWFPLLGRGCGADYVCVPAPVHHPDGSESLWCYTKPRELYGTLIERLGHFPLQHFWGPQAGIPATHWIVDSALLAAQQFQPHFFYIYLPHLDYEAQRSGPDSPQAQAALGELDGAIRRLAEGLPQALGDANALCLAASEYVITPVDQVSFPNRVLRQAGLLRVRQEEDGEHLDLENSLAWALADHQVAHVYVQGAEPELVARVTRLFCEHEGVAEVLAGADRDKYAIRHERSGDVVLIAAARCWFAYYWWLDDACAPGFARTVDIHRKPGYDPVELCYDRGTRGIPLDAALIRGSHGAPAATDAQRGVLLASQTGVLRKRLLADTEVAAIVLRCLQR